MDYFDVCVSCFSLSVSCSLVAICLRIAGLLAFCVFCFLAFVTLPYESMRVGSFNYRRMAENGFAPPPRLGNFADISYLVEN